MVGVAFRTLLAPSGPLGALRLDGTAAAIIAAMVFFNLAVVVRTVGSLWENLDRRREEAAAALGASPVQVLRTVTLPALMPGVVSSASVVFLFCATSFGVVLTLGGLRYSTVETEIYLLTTQFLDLRAASALSVLQLVVVSVLLYGAQRTRSGREQASTAHRTRDAARRPRRGDLPVLLTTGVTLLLVAAPLLALVVRSLRVEGGVDAAELPRPRPRPVATCCWYRPPRRSRTPGGSPSTRRCSRWCSACWSRWWSSRRRDRSRRPRHWPPSTRSSCCRSGSPR